MGTLLIGQLLIHDREQYRNYESKVLSTVKKHGGRLIFLSDEVQVLEGKYDYKRTVIMEFPSKQIAEGWYNSPEYQEIIPLRTSSSDANIIVVENILQS
jgi:uncharacterized protein (DUF1330 family)